MITIPKNKLLDRWDILPDILRDAIFSDVNSDFIWKTCEDEHIPDEKIYTISQVAGYVFMGFLHPEDVAGEIEERLSLDSQTANSIQDALNKRIFTPLRVDINRIYSPISTLEAATMAVGPKVFQDIGPMVPAPLPEVGWSKLSPSSSVPKPTPTVPTSASPISSLSSLPSSSKPPTPVASTKPVSEPAPMILHEDTTFKAAEKNAGFTLSRPDSGADAHIGQVMPGVPVPPRPAVLEFGGAKPAASAPSGTGIPAVVHYTDFKSPLASAPTANTGPRNVSQITGIPAAPPAMSSAAPLAPPMPPMPPKPPTPPSGDKPIVKDFL